MIWKQSCAAAENVLETGPDLAIFSAQMSSQPSPSPDQDAHEVLRAIRRIVRKISSHSKHLSLEIGLTVPQLMCLKAIGELEETGTEEITVAKVAERVQLSAATVSRVVDRLVNGGLVLRERTAPDRRKVALSLTPSGLDRFHSLPVPLQEKFVERLRALSEEEKKHLLSSLHQLASLMDAETLDAAPILHPDEALSGAGPGEGQS